MKITGPGGPGAAATSRPARASSGGFALPAGGASPAASAAASTQAASVSGVSALMALQGVEDATERRRRAIRRGGGLLDQLDDLKLALLSGDNPAPALERLGRVLGDERPEDDHPGLKDLLDQIDTRAAVELAKADMRRAAA